VKKRPCVVVGITGGIAAYKVPQLVGVLSEAGCDARVVMTEEAQHFVSPLVLEKLSRNPVGRGLFEEVEVWDVEHVALADRADAVVIVPATAHIIGKLANGICDDLLTCVVTATRAPILLAPAMNDVMWANKAVQANVERLKEWKYKFIGPERGRLACGRQGLGRMTDIDAIARAALRLARR
jgi:phosphopantothenoylcysteine decarboxylase/phosphopantothenate--cysteine ligase